VVTVGLAEVLDEEDLLKALGRALSLANDGENWDSLRQALRELGDRDPWRIAVIFTAGDVFATKNIHSFVRAVSVLQGLAADLSSILERPYGQLELFYVGQWSRFGGA
jgi:hypothetical protein